MTESLRQTVHQQHKALSAMFDASLRSIARRSVRVWFNRDRLDRVLSEGITQHLSCDLIYAIDTEGRQVSSNIHNDSIDQNSYGQDLSRRPYLVSLSILHNAAFQGAFLCDAYISQVTRRPCVTLMYGVTAGPTILGFVAADLDQRKLPVLPPCPADQAIKA